MRLRLWHGQLAIQLKDSLREQMSPLVRLELEGEFFGFMLARTRPW